MYLDKKTYVKNYDYMDAEQKYSVEVLKNGKPTSVKSERVKEITEEIGYWRKANQIHNWFLKKMPNGEEWNGSDYCIGKKDLKELLETCKKVLEASKLVEGMVKNGQRLDGSGKGWQPILEKGLVIEYPTVAKELLPNTTGFFFGSQEYDEYYIQDIKATIEILEEALKDDEGDFYYSASW